MSGWMGKPTPGSDAARDLGCRCPVLDNAHGKFAPYPPDGWWIVESCPVHGADGESATVDGSVDTTKIDVADPSPEGTH